jgi:ribosome-associated translation inhibitor RaiA
MKLNLQHLNLRSRDDLDRWVEEQILALGEARRIDEANVRLECRFEASPPFAARIHLVTPGPDIFAESCDHTIRAAFARALRQLKERIVARAGKPAQRARTRRSAPAMYSRWIDAHRSLR